MRLSRTFFVTLLLATATGCGINTEGSLDTDTIQPAGGANGGGKGGQGGTGIQVGGRGGGSGQGGGGGTSPQTICTLPSQCDDGSSCTIDACVQGVCQNKALPSGSSCTDGDKCNGEEVCNATGTCVPGKAIDTDDKDGCTADLCDPVTGTVSHKGTDGCKPCPNGDTDCDDGNQCTAEMCIAGTCHYSNVAVGTTCDDGNLCTVEDRCDQGGNCQGTGKPTTDNNTCTVDSCDLATGEVTHMPIDQQPCSDNNICTENDLCNSAGECKGTDLPTIDDQDGCTTDLCDPVTGSVTHKGQNGCKPCTQDAQCDDGSDCTTEACVEEKCVYTYKFSDEPCDDGNKCTENDLCDGSGTCKGSNKSFEDSNPCTDDACDPKTGESKHAPLSGQPCDDKNGCTENDTCNSQGQCKGSNKATNDGSDCTTDGCNETTGEVTHAPIPGCKACATPTDCNDGNPCTTETCQNAKCIYTNVAATTPCSDGKKCTDGDTCDGNGVCKGTTITCPASANPCSAPGVCNEIDGKCGYAQLNDGTACDDKSPCTTGDVCQLGVCKGTLNCTTPPTGSACYKQVGTCVNNACAYDVLVGTSCDDKNVCTTSDVCKSDASCKGTDKVCPTTCSGNLYSAATVCMAPGGCGLATPTACSNNLACADASVCRTSCTPNSLSDCATNTYCAASGTQCVPRLDPGTVCTDANQCKSGNCLLSTTSPTRRCATASMCDAAMCMAIDATGSCVSTCTGGATCQAGTCVTGSGGASGAAGGSGSAGVGGAGASGASGQAGTSAGGTSAGGTSAGGTSAGGTSAGAGAGGTSAGGGPGGSGTAGAGGAGAGGASGGTDGAGDAGAAGSSGTAGAGGAAGG